MGRLNGKPARGAQGAQARSAAPISTRRLHSQKRAKLSEDLAAEVDALRASLADMVAAYKLKLDAELVELSIAARGHHERNGKPRPMAVAKAEKMLDRLRELDIKPHKGRAKDFQRLQNVIGELIEELQ